MSRYIKIEKNSNGSHNNQEGFMTTIPEGWAIVPDNLTCENYPFGDVSARVIDGVPTIISWSALPIPIPEPEPENSSSISDELTNIELAIVELFELIGGANNG